ncbi:iron-sulfur cluster assembly accessory protein [bacterium]|nr:iron-sulfur cluster assembly accessory protein [bacterium]
MFEITDNAAKQFKTSAEAIGDDTLSFRISARKSETKGIQYNMGFDKPREEDISCLLNGIQTIVDPKSAKLVKSMIIDFRELDGLEQFVFINPNDKENCETSPSGCDPEGNASCRSCQED